MPAPESLLETVKALWKAGEIKLAEHYGQGFNSEQRDQFQMWRCGQMLEELDNST